MGQQEVDITVNDFTQNSIERQPLAINLYQTDTQVNTTGSFKNLSGD